MPVLRNLNLHLGMDQILRRYGMGEHVKSLAKSKSKLPLSIYRLMEKLNKNLNGLLTPAISYNFYSIAKIESSQLFLEDGTGLKGSLLPKLFRQGKELMVSACTIGPGLEEKVEEHLKSKDILTATLLDGMGSAAVDDLLKKIPAIAKKRAEQKGFKTSGCISPGRREFTLEEQPKILRLAHAGEIGVRSTSHNMMIPGQSTSVVIGIGPKMPFWDQKEACGYCDLKDRCAYKVMVEG
ncbi:MAG: Vitamin B12 dependent methionine synthase, activation domain [Candidatus Methanolliviera sp. GoM_oil]|nr:MAG: Vitamin B12 dependent methionine synthase, activation domain [Candidatus Methanolliviera sp. GoM_oil]